MQAGGFFVSYRNAAQSVPGTMRIDPMSEWWTMRPEASGRKLVRASWSTMIPVTRAMARANQAASSIGTSSGRFSEPREIPSNPRQFSSIKQPIWAKNRVERALALRVRRRLNFCRSGSLLVGLDGQRAGGSDLGRFPSLWIGPEI